MKLYVISTKYLPLVDEHQPSIQKKDITPNNLKAIFNASRTETLIACKDKKDALTIMIMLLKEHYAAPNIEKNIHLLGTPVVYTINFDANYPLPKPNTLTENDLFKYMDTSTLPLYDPNADNDDFIIPAFDKRRKNHWVGDTLVECLQNKKIYKLDGLKLDMINRAHYVDHKGKNIISVDLNGPSKSLFSSMLSFTSSSKTEKKQEATTDSYITISPFQPM